MMTMVVGVRPAQFNEDDARLFAWGLDEASQGAFTAVLGSPGQELMARMSLQPGHEFSLEHVRIAVADGRPVGVVSSMAAQHCVLPTRVARESLGWRSLRALPAYLAARPLLRALSWHDPGDWYVLAVAVQPQARDRGVGRALIYDCMDRAREGRAEWLTLDVSSDNSRARELYEEMGMVTVATSAPARLLGGVQVHRMVLDLLE